MSNTKVQIFAGSIMVFLLQNFIFGQNYLVGFSKESINPNSTILSSPLAGFGDPKQGRFSISFQEAGIAQNAVAMCSSDTKFYMATSDNKLWQADINAGTPNWVSMGMAYYVTALAYGNGKLYGTDKYNKLWMRNADENDSPWTNIGSAYETTGLTLLNNKLYGTKKNNTLWVRDTSPSNIPWKNIGKANSVRSLTNDGTHLIALSKYDNDLWTRGTSSSNESWSKIGTPNRTTYGSYLSNITYVNNKLYATSNKNKLYYSQHSQSPIYAYASYFEKNSKKALIITLDLCGINYSFSHKVKTEIKNLYNIDEDAILINCSHTHYAPVSQNYSCLQDFYHNPDPKYLDIVKNSVLTATQNAINNKTESNLSFVKGKTNIGYNRADISKDLDNNITMVIAKQSTTNMTNGVILSASTHPVWYNQPRDFVSISSNYVGATRDKLGILKNINNVQLMQGWAGDINPYKTDTPDQTANKLTQDFSNLFALSSSPVTGEITVKLDSIAVPLNNFSFNRAVNIKKANTGKYDQVSERNVRWANNIIHQYTSGTLSKSATIYIQILKIGDWNIVALSREAVSQYAIDLYNHYNPLKLTVLGYSNDVSSYLPVQWHIKKTIPNYEGYESFFIYGQSGIPVNNVEDIILAKIYSMMQ
ncbi:hypothetical protein ACM46_19205 [Chryseobacterium angstadtii]|uniref:Neutral/alkaline non-lysosomal ceramidase N-terminal domain-containing protein n=1 Tax=Chryseobacterium angstadtii TaxID=558151 RepID=A0A0J7HZX3_9FLAO|nr:PQQ-binding-like beta-propeller repeat protein [Chryseobacterium angstadtii]KMQ59264.1 hypothetical protein ACM46_19205 [Chryseobacterium angstadtii]